jgi:hypothetical protein
MRTVAKVPCGSCPYRKDVPSGIWMQSDYDKLPAYDGPTWAQPFEMFGCHQRDDNLCAGWLACHGTQGENALLSVRMAANRLDPVVWTYRTRVPLFASGTEACAHGLRDIRKPGKRARKMIVGLLGKLRLKPKLF